MAGASGASASQEVGVSLNCGSLWFIDAGSVRFIDTPTSTRYLTQDDRIQIADGLSAGESVKSIALRIGKSYRSIYREIARNKKPNGGYQPWYARSQAHLRRRRARPRRSTADERLRGLVADKLAQHWSPAQISRWLRRRWPDRPTWHLCHETIYEAVYHGLVVRTDQQTLRTGRTYRHKGGRGLAREGALKQLTDMKSIHQRPARVEARIQIGHWEGDLVIGARQGSAIATLVERKTRHTMLITIRGNHPAQNVADTLIDALVRLPRPLRRTLTWDQGNEMFQHARIERATGIQIYFADPHSPWQRGTNENTNGLLRHYFPKGIDFDHVSDSRIRQVADELNQRPRLCTND